MLGRILNWFRGPDSSAQGAYSKGIVRSGDPSSYVGQDHLLKGLRFCATLRLDTPLAILRHHGELYEGPVDEAPAYGGPAEGTWVPEVDWDRVGLTPPPDGTMWTPVGQVPPDGGEVLPFLKRFREVVESGGTTDEKLDALTRMMRSSPEVRDLGTRFDEDFPESWFWKQLQVVPGVGLNAARKLFDAGFRDLDALESAEPESLKAVRGVGPKIVDQIQRFLADTREVQEDPD